MTVIATLQNSVVSYNTLKLTYLLIVGIAAQLIGIYTFWLIQKRFGLSTKVMFDAVMLGILLLDAWGMVGIWSQVMFQTFFLKPSLIFVARNSDSTMSGSFGYTRWCMALW